MSAIHSLNEAIQHSFYGDCRLIEFGGSTKAALKLILMKLEKDPHLDIDWAVDHSGVNSNLKDLIKASLKNNTIRKQLLAEQENLDEMIHEFRHNPELATKIIEVHFDEIVHNPEAARPKEKMWNEIHRAIYENDIKSLTESLKKTSINFDDLLQDVIIHRNINGENSIYLPKKEKELIDRILSISPLQIEQYFTNHNEAKRRITNQKIGR